MAVTLLRACSAVEAERLRAATPGAAFAAGATALQLAWGEDPAATLVDVARLPELRGIGPAAGGGLRIGAGEPLEMVRTHALVRRAAPLLARACETLAAYGVRGLATLGGNVGWRCGDTLAALLACAARAECADGTQLPLADLLARPSLPLVVALYLPPAAGAGWFDKAGLRAAFSPSRLVLALQEADDGLRAAATGAGLPARRLAAVEAWCRAQGTHTLSTGLPTGLSTAAARALRAACGADLPEDAARAELAARLVAGRLGRPAEVPAA